MSQTIETMNDEKEYMFAFKASTYKRYYGDWVHSEEVIYIRTGDELQNHPIFVNQRIIQERNPKTPDEWRATLEEMIGTTRQHDRHFPEVQFNAGAKSFSKEEIESAKNTIESADRRRRGVIDLAGILTTPDAEFDRAMIHQSVQAALLVIECAYVHGWMEGDES